MNTPERQTIPNDNSTASEAAKQSDAASQFGSSGGNADSMSPKPPIKFRALAKTFSMMPEDVELVQALRLLIREWQRSRATE